VFFNSLHHALVIKQLGAISFVLTLHHEQECSSIPNWSLACARFNILIMSMPGPFITTI
jgi:hypothetical protein